MTSDGNSIRYEPITTHNGLDYEPMKPYVRPVVYDRAPIPIDANDAWTVAWHAMTFEQRNAWRDLASEDREHLQRLTAEDFTKEIATIAELARVLSKIKLDDCFLE